MLRVAFEYNARHCKLEHGLVYAATDADRVRRRRIDLHDHFRRGDITDPAVEREQVLAIFPRVASKGDAAPDEPLVEPREPAEARKVLQVDVLRMHHLSHRRSPAERKRLAGDLGLYLADRHPPCWQHGEAQHTVVDLNLLAALLAASM